LLNGLVFANSSKKAEGCGSDEKIIADLSHSFLRKRAGFIFSRAQ
jgi:hypothetical protein